MALTDVLTAIGDALRAKTGRTGLIPLVDMPSVIADIDGSGSSECSVNHTTLRQEGYDEGYAEGYSNGETAGYADGRAAGQNTAWSDFWDIYQNNGSRTNYSYAFYGAGWDNNTFKPKYNIVLSGTNSAMFQSCKLKGSLTEILNGKEFDTTLSNTLVNLFNGANLITEVPKLVVKGTSVATSVSLASTFSACTALEKVELDLQIKVSSWASTFSNCTSLVDLTITGTIDTTGFDVHWSTKLSRNSLLSILNALNVSVSNVTVTLPVNCIDGETDTLTTIQNDAELNTAYTTALANGYTITFA